MFLKTISSKIITVFALALFITLIASTCIAATYYVDNKHPNASDSNPGSETSPWNTIRKAANTMVAGDTAIVSEGTYPERVTMNNSGSAGKQITFSASGSVSMQGWDLNSGYVTVDGFEITGSSRQGVLFGSSSNNNIVSNNEIHHNPHAGIWLKGADHLIENNDIHHSILDFSVADDADFILFFGSGHIIRGNNLHDNYKQGGDPHIDCFQTWGPASDILIENNICNLPTQSGHMQGSNLSGSIDGLTFKNNTFINIGSGGINNWHGGAKNLHVLNNTFHGVGSYPVELMNNTGAIVKNNIFSNCAKQYLSTNSSVDVGHNAVYNGGSTPPGSANTGDKWNVNPLFVDAANGDLSLQPGSPLIDAGIALPNVTEDFNGTPRPVNGAWDIGAFEYSTNGTSTAPSAPRNLIIIK